MTDEEKTSAAITNSQLSLEQLVAPLPKATAKRLRIWMRGFPANDQVQIETLIGLAYLAGKADAADELHQIALSVKARAIEFGGQ